jgi:hypothetical protein
MKDVPIFFVWKNKENPLLPTPETIPSSFVTAVLAELRNLYGDK